MCSHVFTSSLCCNMAFIPVPLLFLSALVLLSFFSFIKFFSTSSPTVTCLCSPSCRRFMSSLDTLFDVIVEHTTCWYACCLSDNLFSLRKRSGETCEENSIRQDQQHRRKPNITIYLLELFTFHDDFIPFCLFEASFSDLYALLFMSFFESFSVNSSSLFFLLRRRRTVM